MCPCTWNLAFGNRIARADDSVVIRATDASALPHRSKATLGAPMGSVLGSHGLTKKSFHP